MNGKKTTSAPMLLNAKEAARELGIGLRKLWSLTNTRELPHVRIGRCVRYCRDDVTDFIESRRQGGNV